MQHVAQLPFEAGDVLCVYLSQCAHHIVAFALRIDVYATLGLGVLKQNCTFCIARVWCARTPPRALLHMH